MGVARVAAGWGGRLAAAARAGADLLLPVACVACRRPVARLADGIVCGPCWSRLALLPEPQCRRCGHPHPGPYRCRWCEPLPPFVRAVRSVAWVHRGTATALLHALKYDGWHRVAAGMAERMARLTWPPDVVSERALVVPVPLAAARRRERGYNQSEQLAGPLARRWGVALAPELLVRPRGSGSQTRLTPAQRMLNVARAFRVPDEARPALRGAHVVLVDDVVTTAATLAACAAALHAGGARIVSCITFGRAPALGDR